MQLYHATAVPPTAVTAAVQGSFTAPKHQELVLATTTSLELYRFHPKHGQLRPLFRTDLHAAVRAIAPFRLPGTKRHYLLLTSDAGTLTVLSADAAARCFRPVHAEPFARSGARPAVPGQFVAADPHGRAALIASLQRPRLAYVLNRDAEDVLTISSPLDARAPPLVAATFHLAALDVGFENPLFAALERAHAPAPAAQSENDAPGTQPGPDAAKTTEPRPDDDDDDAPPSAALALYELDLGLNCVVRKNAAPLRDSANLILPVPGAADGPGGALVCSDGWVSYFTATTDVAPAPLTASVSGGRGVGDASARSPSSAALVEARLPVREGTDPEVLIVSATMYHDKKGAAFFFLLCTEHGDLIKADLRAGPPAELRLAYFDSLPAPATAMVIFRAGYLFAALEGGDSLLLKFQAVEVPDDAPGISAASASTGVPVSASPPTTTAAATAAATPEAPTETPSADPMDTDLSTKPLQSATNPATTAARSHDVPFDPREPDAARYGPGALARIFPPRTRLQRLALVEQIASLAPVLAVCPAGPRRDAIFLACGRGRAGALRLLRRGVGALPLSAPHNLPARARAVFALPASANDATTRLLVVSFADRSRALAVLPDRVDETRSSGLELGAPTFVAALLGHDSIAQAHARGVRFLPAGAADKATEWTAPVPARVVAAAANEAQLIVALSSGSLVYFELDADKPALLEVTKVQQAVTPSESPGLLTQPPPPALAFMSVPPGRLRAPFVVVADGPTKKVRLYRVTSDSALEPLGVHVAPAPVHSVALVNLSYIPPDISTTKDTVPAAARAPQLTLFIGTTAGAAVRLPVDETSGALGDKRTLFLGAGAVRARALRIGGLPVCLLLGARPWLLHSAGGRVAGGPLGCAPIDDAADFAADGEDGFVAVGASALSLHVLDLIHALHAAAAMPTAGPALGLPANASLGASFQTWRSRTAGTPRRLIPLDIRGKRAGSLFVVVETDHRAALNSQHDGRENGAAEGRPENTSSSPFPDVRIAPSGSWFSRLKIVRLVDGDQGDGEGVGDGEGDGGGDSGGNGNDAEDQAGDDDTELDATDPLSNYGVRAVSVVSSVTCASAEECVMAVASNAAFGSEDGGDTVSYVVASVATHLQVNATAPPTKTVPKPGQSWMENGREKEIGNDTGKNGELNKTAKTVFGALVVYRVTKALKLERMHETRLAEPAAALTAFRDMVAAGVGAAVRLYALGKKQVLRKVECRSAVPRRVGVIASAPGGDRLFVADCGASVALLQYERGAVDKDDPGKLVGVAIEPLARWVTCLVALDHATVAVGDKFGSVAVLRLPPEAGNGGGEADGAGEVSGRLDIVASMHVGACVTALTTGRFDCGADGMGRNGGDGEKDAADADADADAGDENVVYATAAGAVGVLAAVRTEGQAKALVKIETAMRACADTGSATGRSHEAFRSMFYVRRAVVDGDLCEMFFSLGAGGREEVAEAAGRTAVDVARSVDEARAAALLL